jgi:Mn-dependent DtxR family transcriptional regulator
VTASEIHRKLQEISRHGDGQGRVIKLEKLANEFQSSKDDLHNQIEALTVLGLVVYHDERREAITLTESGRLANLP